MTIKAFVLIVVDPATLDAREAIDAVAAHELAHLAQIDRSHMGKIERGERNVTLLNLIKIAQALESEPSTLLREAGL